MKIFRVVLALAFVFVAFSATGASAGAFTYTSGFQVQNLEATQASIGITFYNQDGSVEADVTDSIDANGSKTYFPLTDVADGFNGSVVIASSTQVAAIGNVIGDSGTAAASYSASASGSTTVQIPLLMQNNAGYYTWFNVQNTGSAAATVNVAYSDGTSAGPVTIQPGAAYTFDQATETHTQVVFAATVTSDQPVAATVIEERNDAQAQLMFAYSGFTGAGSTDPVMPLINANNAGYKTGVQIQNAGDQSTDVTVSYTPAGPNFGTACTETRTIAANSSATFALLAFNNGDSSTCAGGERFVGSAQVTTNSASQPLFLIVNQLNLPASKAEAYNGFDTSAATGKVVMPLIMDRNANYFTGFNVMNIGSEALVTCTFTDSSYTVSATLGTGEALNDIQNNKMTDTPPYIGSGTCTAASGGALLAVVNEVRAGAATDLFLVYEGANTTP